MKPSAIFFTMVSLQAGSALASPLPAPVKLAPSSSTGENIREFMEWDSKWDLKGGTGVKGDTHIEFHHSGQVRFKGHMHTGGALEENYAVACALRDTSGKAYTLTHQGKVHGTLSPGSRNSDWDLTKQHSDVARHWAHIAASDKMHCRVEAKWGVAETLKDVIGAVEKYGPIVGEVVALF